MRYRAGIGGRHDEGVTNKLRTSRLDRVVVGNDAVCPNLMQFVQATIHINQTVGKAMCAFIQITVRLDETALMENLPASRL